MSSGNLFAIIAFACLWLGLGGFFWLVFRFLATRKRGASQDPEDPTIREHGL